MKMLSNLRLDCAALALLGVLFVSCGDDDNPAAADDPCDDANATCLTLQVTPADVGQLAVYNPGPNTSQHAITWDVDRVLSDYAPGQHITLTVKFNPPVKVRYDHLEENLTISAGPEALCYDRTDNPDYTFTVGGWTRNASQIDCMGACTTGESRVVFSAGWVALESGDQLAQVTFDFVVPDTYSLGAGAGTPI